MTQRELATQAQDMTVAEVKNLLCPKATHAEAHLFIKFCVAQGLNPFLGDAYLIKYQEDKPAAIHIGLGAVMKRARRNRKYKTYQSGIIVQEGEQVHFLDGSFNPYPKAHLVGGWCDLYRRDLEQPLRVRVAFEEYCRKNRDGTPMALWKEKPGTQIEKVAIHQAHRRSFPEEVGQLYDVALPDTDIAGDYVEMEGENPQEQGDTPQEQIEDRPITEAQRRRLFAIANEHGVLQKEIKTWIQERFGVDSTTRLTTVQMSQVVEWLESHNPQQSEGEADQKLAETQRDLFEEGSV